MITQAGAQRPKEDRDPNKINQHLKIQFYDILGEPNGSHSCSFIWDCSEICYSFLSSLCYGLLSCLCGVWIVMYWGCVFGYSAFVHIWILSPFMFCANGIIQIFTRPLKPIINCCVRPWTGACAHFFILFAEPGTDIDKWNYPEIKTPVRKVKLNQVSPEPVSKPKEKMTEEEKLWLGEKEKMARSVKRQMML